MAMEVMEGKIAIVEGSGDGWRHRSLVVIEMVDNVWIRKDLRIEKADNFWMRRDLAQWQLPRLAETCMASDKDVWVILELDILRVYTSSDDGKELKLPVSGNGYRWEAMSMSFPFLFTFKAQGSNVQLHVFKVPTDKDIGTDSSLLKSINIVGVDFRYSPLKPFYSTFVVGVLHSRQTVGPILQVFETAKLLDVRVLQENVERREVELRAGRWPIGPQWPVCSLSSLNTTSLVYIKNRHHRQSLVKRDFWMSNSKSE